MIQRREFLSMSQNLTQYCGELFNSHLKKLIFMFIKNKGLLVSNKYEQHLPNRIVNKSV